jgi:amidase
MRYESATLQLKALRSGEVSSVQLVERALERIEQVDGALNAVVVRDLDCAHEAATQVSWPCERGRWYARAGTSGC